LDSLFCNQTVGADVITVQRCPIAADMPNELFLAEASGKARIIPKDYYCPLNLLINT
jgi:hypothetical protein